MIVMKFGGTSVEDAAAIDCSCKVVGARISRGPFGVVSALGGATNDLLEAGTLAAHGEAGKAMEIAERLEKRHAALLPSTAEYFARLRELLKALIAIGEFSTRTQDLVASYGEALSSLIFADRMKRLGFDAVHVDARQCMITDDHFGKASPIMDLTTARLEQAARPHLNSRKPAGTGTRITREARLCKNLIKSIAVKRGITVVTVSSSRMLMAHGFLRALFEVFDRHRTSVDMVATSEVSVSLTLDNVSSLDAIVEDLKQLGDVEITSKAALVCLVGTNLKYTPGVARRAFGSLSDINILMVSHGASNINFSFIVDEKDATTTIQRLHADFFSEIDPEVFEPTA